MPTPRRGAIPLPIGPLGNAPYDELGIVDQADVIVVRHHHTGNLSRPHDLERFGDGTASLKNRELHDVHICPCYLFIVPLTLLSAGAPNAPRSRLPPGLLASQLAFGLLNAGEDLGSSCGEDTIQQERTVQLQLPNYFVYRGTLAMNAWIPRSTSLSFDKKT